MSSERITIGVKTTEITWIEVPPTPYSVVIRDGIKFSSHPIMKSQIVRDSKYGITTHSVKDGKLVPNLKIHISDVDLPKSLREGTRSITNIIQTHQFSGKREVSDRVPSPDPKTIPTIPGICYSNRN